MLPMFASGRRNLPQITVGGNAELLADEHYVIDACRKAGIDSQNDDLRRAAVGRVVKVLERDDWDGTVRCQVPGVGLVWFAMGCFAARGKDDAHRIEEGSTTVSDSCGYAAPSPMTYAAPFPDAGAEMSYAAAAVTYAAPTYPAAPSKKVHQQTIRNLKAAQQDLQTKLQTSEQARLWEQQFNGDLQRKLQANEQKIRYLQTDLQAAQSEQQVNVQTIRNLQTSQQAAQTKLQQSGIL